MDERYDEYPSVCIDLKKSRVRIHKKMIHQMNDPQYIELLVNPKKKCFIVRIAPERKTSHRIMIDMLAEKQQCCELYSREFIREIQKVGKNLRSLQSYRIIGRFSADRSAARFILKDAQLIETGKEDVLYA